MKRPLKEFEIEPHMTHKQIAKEIGVTRAAVGHIEERAMAKLKDYCRRENLKLEDML